MENVLVILGVDVPSERLTPVSMKVLNFLVFTKVNVCKT